MVGGALDVGGCGGGGGCDTEDCIEFGGGNPLLSASACSDNINRLAACRSASRSSAVCLLLAINWGAEHEHRSDINMNKKSN